MNFNGAINSIRSLSDKEILSSNVAVELRSRGVNDDNNNMKLITKINDSIFKQLSNNVEVVVQDALNSNFVYNGNSHFAKVRKMRATYSPLGSKFVSDIKELHPDLDYEAEIACIVADVLVYEFVKDLEVNNANALGVNYFVVAGGSLISSDDAMCRRSALSKYVILK